MFPRRLFDRQPEGDAIVEARPARSEEWCRVELQFCYFRMFQSFKKSTEQEILVQGVLCDQNWN
jgi:hypothetical protein